MEQNNVNSQAELTNKPDGVYTVASDPFNYYVVYNFTYTMVSKSVYNQITAKLIDKPNAIPTKDLIQLKEGGYTVDDLLRLRKEGLL